MNPELRKRIDDARRQRERVLAAKRAARPNKYDYLFIVQGSYGYGWEDLTAEDTRSEARDRLREYRENEPGTPHRLIKRRELRAVEAVS